VTRTAAAAEELQQAYAHGDQHVNYASVKENTDAVRAELNRLTDLGFMTKVDNWRDLRSQLGPVVVSKMAAIVKERGDGTMKLRLITDMLRSGVNAFVKLSERIVLPRLYDMIEAALRTMENTADGEEVEMMVSDFSDAFHSMGVLKEERRHQVLRRECHRPGESLLETLPEDRGCRAHPC
jgi:hypothetical protein